MLLLNSIRQAGRWLGAWWLLSLMLVLVARGVGSLDTAPRVLLIDDGQNKFILEDAIVSIEIPAPLLFTRAATHDGCVFLMEADEGEEETYYFIDLNTLSQHRFSTPPEEAYIYQAMPSPDRRKIALIGDNWVYLLHLDTGRIITLTDLGVFFLGFWSPDSRYYIYQQEGNYFLYDTQTETRRLFTTGQSALFGGFYNDDIGSYTDRVEETMMLNLGSGIQWSPSGRYVFGFGATDNTYDAPRNAITVADTQQTAHYHLPNWDIFRAMWLNDQQVLVSGAEKNGAGVGRFIWTFTSGQLEKTDKYFVGKPSPDFTKYALPINTDDQSPHIYDTLAIYAMATGELIASFPIELFSDWGHDLYFDVVWSPDSRWLLVANTTWDDEPSMSTHLLYDTHQRRLIEYHGKWVNNLGLPPYWSADSTWFRYSTTVPSGIEATVRVQVREDRVYEDWVLPYFSNQYKTFCDPAS